MFPGFARLEFRALLPCSFDTFADFFRRLHRLVSKNLCQALVFSWVCICSRVVSHVLEPEPLGFADKGNLFTVLQHFPPLPQSFGDLGIVHVRDCSMIFLLSTLDHTIKAFMGRLMWPVAVLHQSGFGGTGLHAISSFSSVSVVSRDMLLSVWLHHGQRYFSPLIDSQLPHSKTNLFQSYRLPS